MTVCEYYFVHPALLAMAIPALSQAVTLEEFQRQSGIISKRTARCVLGYLLRRGIGRRVSQYGYSFSNADRMKLAILAIQSGNDVERISESLSWQDFEAFASNLLNLSGYMTECNLHFSKSSRMQIDVVGFNRKSRLAIVLDCKHWKQNHLSSISSYAIKQAQRASELLTHRRMISHAIPVILTLYPMDIRFADGVPLVPIAKFNSFVQDLQFYISEINVVYGTNTTD